MRHGPRWIEAELEALTYTEMHGRNNGLLRMASFETCHEGWTACAMTPWHNVGGSRMTAATGWRHGH